MTPEITRTNDGNFARFSFTAGHAFDVLYSPRSRSWTVYRHPKGLQRNNHGKTFHRAEDMARHYRDAATAAALAAIAAECQPSREA